MVLNIFSLYLLACRPRSFAFKVIVKKGFAVIHDLVCCYGVCDFSPLHSVGYAGSHMINSSPLTCLLFICCCHEMYSFLCSLL